MYMVGVGALIHLDPNSSLPGLIKCDYLSCTYNRNCSVTPNIVFANVSLLLHILMNEVEIKFKVNLSPKTIRFVCHKLNVTAFRI